MGYADQNMGASQLLVGHDQQKAYGVCRPPDRPPLLDEFQKLICELNEVTGMLRVRLMPVLRPEPSELNKSCNPAAPEAPLRNEADGLRVAIVRLRSLGDQIDL